MKVPPLAVSNPSTFSMINQVGLTEVTISTKFLSNAFLGSAQSLVPAELNPWQGGPPTTRSSSDGVSRACSNSSCGRIFNKSADHTVSRPRLRAYVSQASSSTSTANVTSNPACLSPRLHPPQPENKLMAHIIRIPIPFSMCKYPSIYM